MQVKGAGNHLAHVRKRQGRSLEEVARRMRGKSLSKQALSLIERGSMKIPAARVGALKRAYRLSPTERNEFERFYAFEMLVEHTGEDREFGEAVLSVVDLALARSIYVIGGRKLSLASPALQEKAAEFLQRTENKLVFIYPTWKDSSVLKRPVWFPNARREMLEMRELIQSFSKRPLKPQIQFFGIDVFQAATDLVALNALSFCSPFTSTTIAGSSTGEHVAGYVYVEGPRDRWVLLTIEHARRVLATITALLEKSPENGAIVHEELD